MKKKLILIFLVIFIMFNFICFKFLKNFSKEIVVNYNGNNLKIGIDGSSSNTLPTVGNYYLVSYECDNSNTLVSWDKDNYELVVSNSNKVGNISCDLNFKSKPLLSEMPVGSYVKYVGVGGTVGTTSVACQNDSSLSSSSTVSAETEAPFSCQGQNAREDIDTNSNTYGYCYSNKYKYYTTGWRIAYIDSNTNKVAIISAGSPECNKTASSTGNGIYIKTANALALKYCNPELVDGNCTCTSTTSGMCDAASTDAWAINDETFNKMTEQSTGVSGGGYLYTSIAGATKCGEVYSQQVCGYNNDLIDNGGYYWFAAQNSSKGVNWNPINRGGFTKQSTYAYGLRPVISLSSSVYVTGGSGTMDDPYTIAKD